ncbi:MAG: flagellar filament capping protein FliD [Chloroflexi bacterium]|nr:flagellar filament capping protein FliD [Chloroflexota bacterium]
MASSFAVDGIISGLNTRDIVQQLIGLERRPIQLLQKQQSAATSRGQALGSVKAQIAVLQAAVARLSQANNINVKSATVDTPSGSSAAVAASATADAINGVYKLTVSQLATATKTLSTGPMGQVIDRTATLANAGFRLTPITTKDGNPATLSINGAAITVDNATTLDDGTGASLIAKINGSGAGVTASLIADADGRANNRVQIVSGAGQTIQLGSHADTSNMLRLLNLADATVEGYTASQVTSGAVAAGAINASLTINGVTTVINQGDAGYTSEQNAAFITNAINTTTGRTVNATDNGDGTIKLAHQSVGSTQSIGITVAGAETGFVVGTTRNGTDRVIGTQGLGLTNTGVALASSRLTTAIAGLDGSGNGSFKINGVEIAYKATDTISAIVNRVNSSNAGATAFYDTVQDRLQIAATQTGARTLALQDVTGNFLAAAGVVAATQTLGQNAVFTIDTVNGGQPLTSSTNSVSGYLAGVTLDLKTTTSSPVTMTVGQNTTATIETVRSFVNAFNAVLETVDRMTKYDATKKQASALTGDSALLNIERTIRSLVSSSAVGVTGSYQNLASIGVSTGSVGSEIGTATRLGLDESKLTKALAENPQAIRSLFADFAATVGAPAGAGNITAVSGSPTNQHENGTYHVKVLDGSNNVEVRFVTADGRQTMKTTATLTPGVENTTLIPGLKLAVGGALAVGEDTFALSVNTRGVMVRVNDYLTEVTGATGLFKAREDAATTSSTRITRQIEQAESRLKGKEQALMRRFANLEKTMARLQTQGSALASQLSQLNTQTQ